MSTISKNFRAKSASRALHRVVKAGVAVLLAMVAIATAGSVNWVQHREQDRAEDAMQGTFSGQFVKGLPLYRLPPISIVARRSQAPEGK
jgi:hypothetical protein